MLSSDHVGWPIALLAHALKTGRRSSMNRLLRLSLAFASALPLASPAFAENVITIADSTPGNTGSFNVATNRPLGVSWTQVRAFSNVTIEAAIGFPATSGASTIRAFLTTQIGPGTTQGAHQVAASSVLNVPLTTPNVPQPLFALFSGLTLGPGTYFLTAFAAPTPGATGTSAWDGDVPTVTSGVGSTVNGSGFYAANSVNGTYAPASPFAFQAFGPGFLRVTGDLPLLFFDGFESGDSSAWSNVAP
jgi:hypothetical protein